MSKNKSTFKLTKRRPGLPQKNNLQALAKSALTLETAKEQTDFLLQHAKLFKGEEFKALFLLAAKTVEASDPRRAALILDQVIGFGYGCPSVFLGKSIIQHNIGDFSASVESLKHALSMKLSANEKSLAAVMLTKFGQLGLASALSREAYEHSENKIRLAANCLDVAMTVADWDFYDELVPVLEEAYLKGDFSTTGEPAKTNILWCKDEYTNIKVVESWARQTYPHFRARESVNSSDVKKSERIKIGYLSSDFRIHPTAFLIEGLLKNHDVNKFEIFGYCTGWDDDSDIRRNIISRCEKFFCLSGMSDEEAATLIASHQLDVLVELNGATKSNRMGILSFRPTRNQICYLGWPGSVGGRFVDYIVADQYILPEVRAALYPEKIIWLEGTYQINNYSSLGQLVTKSRMDFGLPEDRLILGMFNTINKVSREVWGVWMEVMRRVPETILWLLDPGRDARKNLSDETAKWGVDLDRIVLAPRLPFQDHLERLQVCDLILDPWPIGGHTSAADALYAGVPLVSMRGDAYASRVGGSLLHAAGLGAMVQDNRQEYLSFVVTLLENPSQLSELRSMMKRLIHQSSLFNSVDRTRQFEEVYRVLAGPEPTDCREMRAGSVIVRPKFVVCVISPDGYDHYRAFDELCEGICYGIRELGYACSVLKNQFSKDSVNIIVGAHLLADEHHSSIPGNAIIFNTEPLDSTGMVWRDRILKLTEQRVVWDYSTDNLAYFSRLGKSNCRLYQFGYQSQLDRIPMLPERDIDILFYGSLTTRRSEIINGLRQQGLEVTSVFGVYGRERDRLIARSKIVLNLKSHDGNPMEVVRLSYLMTNGVVVVSEGGQPQDPAIFAEGCMEYVDLADLAATIKDLLRDPQRLDALRAQSRKAFNGQRQSEHLRPLLGL